MAKTIKVGVITQADGAHLSDYFAALAKTERPGQSRLADASGKIETIARKRWARS